MKRGPCKSVILELSQKRSISSQAEELAKVVVWLGQFSATRIAIQNATVWWMQFFLFQHQVIVFLNCTVHNVNQDILQLWVVTSLSRRIAAVYIEPDQSLSHSYDVRWKVAAKWSVFSSQRKMMLSGWLDVSSITVAPGILFAAHAEKKEKEKVKKIKKGKREESK